MTKEFVQHSSNKIKEAGFKRLSFELHFGDSDILAADLKENCDLDDPDIYYLHLLVRLEK